MKKFLKISWLQSYPHLPGASEHYSDIIAFVRGINQWPVNSLQKGPVTRKIFPFDDVIMVREFDAQHVSTRKMSFSYAPNNLLVAQFSESVIENIPQIIPFSVGTYKCVVRNMMCVSWKKMVHVIGTLD